MRHWAPKIAALVLVALITYLLFFVDRNDGYLIFGTVAISGIAWWVGHRGLAWKEALTIGILMRLGALFAFPLLSDDIYRFLWDGELWLTGSHPLDFVPSDASTAFAKTNATLLSKMNSAGYFTVYPPISQMVFTLGAWLGGTIESATIWLKVPLFLGELAVLRLLYMMGNDTNRNHLAAYALLPLPIIEVVGNGHFEGLAVLGVLLAIYGFRQNKSWRSGFGVAFGIGVKLVPALVGPALFIAWLRSSKPTSDGFKPALNFKSSIPYLIFTIFFLGLLFIPFFITADLSGFGESLNLYFQKFEFNGSIYVLASTLGEWYKGWNWIAVIGPSLSIISLISILTLAVIRGWKKLDLATTLLFSFGIYILCATTVHPWYAIYLVALAPLTNYKWPYLLGFTVFLSYLAYGTEDVVVPVWATILEYGSVLGVLIYELRNPSERGPNAQHVASVSQTTIN